MPSDPELPSAAGPKATTPWWRDAVVYQIYPRSFADSDGDGVGDLRGIIAHVDHLVALGVDVVWLSPVHRSPQDDNGYDISDYQDVDPLFGTLADLDDLIATLHHHGIRLVMDLVVNHTSDEHPWFQASRDPGDPHRDWYWWRPAREGSTPGEPGAEPTNWRSFFSGPAWELDPASGEYYLHLFSRKQPDLNWEQPAVRRAVHSMMRWWLERGVDGFRMDVVNMLSKDPSLPDGPPIGDGTLGDPGPAVIGGPRLHEFLREMHDAVFAGRDVPPLTVGEMPGVTIEEAALLTDPDRRELDMVFQFEHVDVDHAGSKWRPRPLDLRDLKASLGRWQTGLAATGWNSLYFCNHDQPRSVSRWGDDGPEHRVRSATMLATVLHLHRGTPYVYQGEELGMTNVAYTSIGQFRDIEAINHHRAAVARGADPVDVLATMSHHRDNARTPMQWDASPQAGFTTGTPWIDVNPNHATINAAAARADERSVFHHYRRLIELRHTSAVVVDGDFTMLLADDPHVYAFTRALGRETLLVLGNFTGDHRPLAGFDEWADAEVVLANTDDAGGAWAGLRPWEAVVLRRLG